MMMRCMSVVAALIVGFQLHADNSNYTPGKALFESIKAKIQKTDKQDLMNASLAVSGACALIELGRVVGHAGAALFSTHASETMVKYPRIPYLGALSALVSAYGLSLIDWQKMQEAKTPEEINALIPQETWEAAGFAAAFMSLRALSKPRLFQGVGLLGLSSAAFIKAAQGGSLNNWFVASGKLVEGSKEKVKEFAEKVKEVTKEFISKGSDNL